MHIQPHFHDQSRIWGYYEQTLKQVKKDDLPTLSV